ncbi:MAG: hypothetical protein QNJ04_11415 [Desulfobacterales bacterium]|nr:hypothetical protein [Desulfobacterales bacterium]
MNSSATRMLQNAHGVLAAGGTAWRGYGRRAPDARLQGDYADQGNDGDDGGDRQNDSQLIGTE